MEVISFKDVRKKVDHNEQPSYIADINSLVFLENKMSFIFNTRL